MTREEQAAVCSEHCIQGSLALTTGDKHFLGTKGGGNGPPPTRLLFRGKTALQVADSLLQAHTGLKHAEYILLRQVVFIDAWPLDPYLATVLYAGELPEVVPIRGGHWITFDEVVKHPKVAHLF